MLGQSGTLGPTTAAVDAGDALLTAALADLTAAPILQPGHDVGRLSAPWGASAPVEVSRRVTVPAWPGRSVSVALRVARLTVPVPAGTGVGWLEVHRGSLVVKVALHATARLRGPSGFWRLTR